MAKHADASPDDPIREAATVRATAADVLVRLRARTPRVHCITNTVAQAFTANVLLAAGAVPSMTLDAGEIAGFVASADALLVNLGTCDGERRAAIAIAVSEAAAHRRPWVLDPVMVERSPPRLEFARALIGRAPMLVRLNTAEFAALNAGAADLGDAARRWRSVVALTGAGDRVCDGVRSLTLTNGHALMAKVTAMGCAASALAAAALAVETDVFRAACGALAIFGVAGERAAALSHGPGTFAAHFLDVLSALTPEDLHAAARVNP